MQNAEGTLRTHLLYEKTGTLFVEYDL